MTRSFITGSLPQDSFAFIKDHVTMYEYIQKGSTQVIPESIFLTKEGLVTSLIRVVGQRGI